LAEDGFFLADASTQQQKTTLSVSLPGFVLNIFILSLSESEK